MSMGAGTVMKSAMSCSNSNHGVRIYVDGGSLVASGQAGNTVRITSISDDLRGGDTNRDGIRTSPDSSTGIAIYSNCGSIDLNYVELPFGSVSHSDGSCLNNDLDPDFVARPFSVANSELGTVSVSTSSSVAITSNVIPGAVDVTEYGTMASVAVSNNTVSNGGLRVQARRAFGASPLVEPVVENNTITNAGNTVVAVSVDADRINPARLTGNRGSGSTIAVMSLSGDLTGNLTLPVAPGTLPVAIGYNGWSNGSTLRVPAGFSVTLSAGTTLKMFENGSISVDGGELNAAGDGVNPVVITSMADDIHGGDTNRDTIKSSPAAGDWSGLYVSGGGRFTASGTQIWYASTALSVDGTSYASFGGKIRSSYGGVYGSADSLVDASGVDWGTPSGPYPYGSGPAVNEYVIVEPWVGYTSFRARYFGGTTESGWAGTASGSNTYWHPYAGDPVDPATGNFTLAMRDITVPEPGPDLVFQRSYNSKAFSSGPLGPKWNHSWETRLVLPAASETATMDLYWGDGRIDSYSVNLDGTFTGAPGNFAVLASRTGGYKVTTKDQVEYQFDSFGRLTVVTDPNGNTLTASRDGLQRVSRVTDLAGRTLSFNYTGNFLTSVIDPAGGATRLSYDRNGRLNNIRDAAGRSVTYTYDSSDRILVATNANGSVDVANAYDTSGRVVRQRNALGQDTTFAYDISNRRTTKTDPMGQSRLYEFDLNGQLLAETDPNNIRTSYVYDSSGNVLLVSDPIGTVEQKTYDKRGNVLTRRDAAGRTTTFVFDANNQATSITDNAGAVASFTYDSKRNVVSQSGPGATSVTMSRDGRGNLLTVRSAESRTTTYTYSSQGDRLTQAAPDGAVTTWTYDRLGRMLTETDPAGGVTTRSYDAVGRLLSVASPASGTTSFAYDNAGNCLTVTDALGRVTTTAYNALGIATSVTNPAGGITKNTFDANGNLISTEDPTGSVKRYTYDAANRLISTTDATGNSESLSLNARGHVVARSDEFGAVTSFAVNGLGQATLITDPLGQVTSMLYDGVGRVLRIRDANLHDWSTTFDQRGLVTSTVDPLQRTWTRTYDGDGNLKSVTDPSGVVESYTFDAAGRRASTTFTGGSTTYRYDTLGRLAGRIDASGSSTFGYDAAGRLTSAVDGKGRPVVLTYDLTGNPITRTALGATTTFGYDTLGRLTSATDTAGNAAWTYDAAGALTAATLPNGVSLKVTNDALHRPQTIRYSRSTQLFSEVLSYDAAGRITSIADPLGARAFTYDQTDRLISEQIGDTTTAYSYDKVGNRTGVTVGMNPTEVTTFDAADQMLTRGDRTYSYTSRGAVRAMTDGSGTTTYGYNGRGALTSIAEPASTTSFTVDDDGVPVSQTTGTMTTDYLFDPASGGADLLGSVTAGVTTRLLRAKSVFGIRTGSSTETVLFDHQNSVRARVNSSGQRTDRNFDSFGQSVGTASSVGLPGYAGGVTMTGGLVRFGARLYDPGSGRFIAPEPDGLRESNNRFGPYVYAQDDPVGRTDVTGRFSLGAVFSAIGNFAGSVWSGAKSVWSTVTQTVTRVVGAVSSAVGSAVVSAVSTAFDWASKFVKAGTALGMRFAEGTFGQLVKTFGSIKGWWGTVQKAVAAFNAWREALKKAPTPGRATDSRATSTMQDLNIMGTRVQFDTTGFDSGSIGAINAYVSGMNGAASLAGEGASIMKGVFGTYYGGGFKPKNVLDTGLSFAKFFGDATGVVNRSRAMVNG